jgi:tripartite motif-containing protein 37
MFKGPSHMQPTEPCKYEYRVEMISHRRPSQKVVREYQSEFEVGECWGYNRFYRIDQLESEGYLSNDSEDCIYLKFYVRPPTYAQLARDQKRYIEELEKKIKAQEEENTQFRKKCSEQNKQKKKRVGDKKRDEESK